MEDFKVKTILTSELQMTNKSLSDNYRNEEWVIFNNMNHEVQNEESKTQKYEFGVSGISAKLVNVFT
jgi:hypothetical protein